jgi:latrophilin 1
MCVFGHFIYLTMCFSRSGAFHNKESHVRQVLQNVLRSASNILETSNRQAWTDLTAEAQKKVATELLLGLDENAFLLAGVMNEPDVFLESSDILSKLSFAR